MMQTTVKERLVAYLRYKKIGQVKFAESVGLSRGYVANIVSSIPQKTLLRITKQYPDLSSIWLLTGEGDMLISSDSSPHTNIGDVSNSNVAVNGFISLEEKKQKEQKEQNTEEENMESSVPIEVFKMVMESHRQQMENQKQQVESQKQQIDKFVAIIQEQKAVIDHLVQRLSVRVDASEKKDKQLLDMYDKLHKWQEEHEKKTDKAKTEIIDACRTVDMTPFIKMQKY